MTTPFALVVIAAGSVGVYALPGQALARSMAAGPSAPLVPVAGHDEGFQYSFVLEKGNVTFREVGTPAGSGAGIPSNQGQIYWSGKKFSSPTLENRDDRTLYRFSDPVEDLVISIPPKALVSIHMMEGQVLLEKLSGEVRVHVHRGQLKVIGGAGSLNAHMVQGQMQVAQFDGEQDLQLAWADLKSTKNKGTSRLESFQNSSEFVASEGEFYIQQLSGSLKLSQIEGLSKVDAQKAQVQISFLKGRHDIQTTEGSIQAQVDSVSDLSLRSHSGKIVASIREPASPLIFAWAGSGDLTAPVEIKSQRDAFGKSARGRWPASEVRGSLNMKTQEGSLVLQ